jgi:hypothetical protein
MMKFPGKLMAPVVLAGFAAGCGTVSTAGAPPVSTSSATSSAPHASKTPAPGHIMLSPSSGPPGTTVTVRGYVPAAAKNPKLQEPRAIFFSAALAKATVSKVCPSPGLRSTQASSP